MYIYIYIYFFIGFASSHGSLFHSLQQLGTSKKPHEEGMKP